MSRKIAFLQDYNIFQLGALGGAEANDHRIFIEGLKRGYELVLLNPEMPFDHSYDLLIISNCVLFDRKRLMDMCKSTKHIFFFHDHIFCRFRTNFPHLDFCRKCNDMRYWSPLFLSSLLLIFLSPLHRHSYISWNPEIGKMKWVAVPSTVDVTRFVPTNINRKHQWLSVDGFVHWKGGPNLWEYVKKHPEKEFVVIGGMWEFEGQPPSPNLKNVGRIAFNEVLKYYQESEWYVELPNTIQPFNRTMCEAYLCGCKIQTNKLHGFFSYDWDYNNRDAVREEIRQAPIKFWEEVENAIN